MPARKTNEQFIVQAQAAHGDKYDYSETRYTGSRDKVKIYCNTCGKFFEQHPSEHLRAKVGCRFCAARIKASLPRLSTEEYIKKAKEIHGDKYNYSETKYTDSRDKVKIYCNKCKEYFEQTAYDHIRKFPQAHGCPKCGNITATEKKTQTTEEYIRKAKKIHGDKYNYSAVVYKNSQTKIKIYCNKCKEYFKQLPYNHLIKESYGGCPICHINTLKRIYKKTNEVFIKQAREIHGNLYSYDKVEYINNKTKVEIYCNTCKEYFWQRAGSHLNIKTGCPICSQSKGELAVANYLDQCNIKYEREYSYQDLLSIRGIRLRFDFYLPAYNILIEFDGIQHYEYQPSWLKKEAQDTLWANDKLKNEYAAKHNITLIRITDTDKIKEAISVLTGNNLHINLQNQVQQVIYYP